MTSPASPAPRATKLTTRTPEDVLAAVPVVLGFEPLESVVMLTFGGVETFHARVDLPPPPEADEAVVQLLEPALQHRVTRVVFVVYADDGPAARAVLRRLRRAFGRAGIDVVEALRAHDGRWFAPGRPGAPAAGVPYDVVGHLFRAQAVVDGIVVHGSRAELEAVLRPSPDAVDEVARAVRRAVPSPPGEIADLVDVRLEAGRFTPVELARVLLGLLDAEGRDAAWAADVPRRRGATRPALDRRRPARPRRPGRGAGRGARAGRVAGRPRRAGLVRRRPVPRPSTPATRWPGWSPTCSPTRCRRPRGRRRRRDDARRPAGAWVPPGAWRRGPSASRRSCWSSTRATRCVTSRAREVLKENREHGRGSSPRSASDELDKELFRHQLEIRTDPTRDVDDTVARSWLVGAPPARPRGRARPGGGRLRVGAARAWTSR